MTTAPATPTEAASDSAAAVPDADLYAPGSDSAKKTKVSEARRNAVRARWESVREEQERWLMPFEDLKIDRALGYLEDLRRIVEKGSAIINERINSDKGIKCAGPRCGRSVEGLRPNGNPKWVATMVLKDNDRPGIQRRIYFCNEVCYNEYIRKAGGALGSESKR